MTGYDKSDQEDVLSCLPNDVGITIQRAQAQSKVLRLVPGLVKPATSPGFSQAAKEDPVSWVNSGMMFLT